MTAKLVLRLVASASWIAAPALAFADDLPKPADVVQKVQDNTYFPKSAGMKDISLTVENSMMSMISSEIAIQYIWKAPDKELLTVTGLDDNPMIPPDQLAGMKKRLVQVARMCVGEGIQDRLKGFELSIAKDGDNFVVTGKTTDPEQIYSEVSYWISPEFLIVKQKGKLTTPSQGQTESEQTYQVEKRNGKAYVVGSSQPDGTQSKVEWGEVSGIFMPVKLTIDSPKSPVGPVSMEFKDVKVNTGLDDALFTPGAAKPAEGKKP